MLEPALLPPFSTGRPAYLLYARATRSALQGPRYLCCHHPPQPPPGTLFWEKKIKISTSAAMVAMETLKPFLRVAPGSSCPTNSWCCGPDAAVPASQSQRWQKQPAKKKKCANYNTGKE